MIALTGFDSTRSQFISFSLGKRSLAIACLLCSLVTRRTPIIPEKNRQKNHVKKLKSARKTIGLFHTGLSLRVSISSLHNQMSSSILLTPVRQRISLSIAQYKAYERTALFRCSLQACILVCDTEYICQAFANLAPMLHKPQPLA